MSSNDLAHIQPYLEPVSLRFRQRLESANRPIKHAYFVEAGIVSVVAVGGDQREVEVGVVGREGMTALSIVYGIDRSPNATFVQVAGYGQRITADDLRRVMSESRTITATLLRYAHAFSIQTHYTALANARGTISQRLARWLLMVHDRTESDSLMLTHELLATMMGVRRAGVTIALHELQFKGLVTMARGTVNVANRPGLEAVAGEYYGVPEAELRRVLPAVVDEQFEAATSML